MKQGIGILMLLAGGFYLAAGWLGEVEGWTQNFVYIAAIAGFVGVSVGMAMSMRDTGSAIGTLVIAGVILALFRFGRLEQYGLTWSDDITKALSGFVLGYLAGIFLNK